MIQINKTLESIFELHATFEKVFFRGFEASYNLPENLNFTHIRTLILLKFKGECSMSEISKITGLEKGSFTPVANKLIKLGYIKKIQDKKDKRVFKLLLTNQGNEFAKEIGKAHVSYIENLIEKLSEEEKESYIASVRLISSLTKKFAE